MRRGKKILIHMLFIAVAAAAVMGLGNMPADIYAAENTVCYEETYADPGKTLTVKYDGSEKNLTYKWYIDGTLAAAKGKNLAVTEDHLEKTIKAEVWSGETKLGETSMFCSKLPVVYLNTEGGAEVVSKDDYIDAQMHMQGNDQYGSKVLYSGATEIKGRGNSTWKWFDKKPYKLKLDKKSDVLGMGKNKHWVLLANYVDESSMRNMLAGELATKLNVGRMDGTWVELVMNGQNLGTYMLCEHVRLSEDRVNVFDWESAAEDVAEAIAEKNGFSEDDMDDLTDQMAEEDMSWMSTGKVTFKGVTYKTADYYEDLPESVSGGWLLEMDTGYDEVSKFTTDREAPLMFKSPEFICTDEVAMNTVQTYVQNFEDALYSEDGCTVIDGKKVSYTELCDTESFVNYILASEMLINEFGYKSTYFQKDIDQPIVFGPVWDFDFSSGASTPFGAQSATVWASKSKRASGNDKWWIGEATSNPYFAVKLRDAYIENEEYLKHIIADGGQLDQWHDYLKESGKYNDELWQYSRGFEADYKALDSWLTERINWMDKQFSTNDTIMDSFGIEFSDSIDLQLQGDSIAYNDGNAYTAAAGGNNFNLNIDVLGSEYSQVNYYVNSRYIGTADLTDGKATVVIREDQLTEDTGDENVITVWTLDQKGKLGAQQYMTVKLTSDTAHYNVVFNDMGGTYANKIAAGKKVYLDQPMYQEENTVFGGWSDGKSTYDAGTWLPVSGDITLNAVWKTCTDGTYEHELAGEEDILTCTKDGCVVSKASGKYYRDIATCGFTVESTYYNYYTGAEIIPQISVKSYDLYLTEGEDYTVEYKDNVDAGYATFIIRGVKSAGFDGEVFMTYRILPRGIYKATAVMDAGCELVNGVAEPEAVLTYEGKTLVEGIDYTVAYYDNTAYGQGYAIFTGKGNFTDTLKKTFNVTKGIGSCTITGPGTTVAYTGKAVKPAVTVKDGAVKLTAGTHYKVTYTNNVNCGTATATVTGIAKNGYSGSETFTYKIRPAKAVVKVTNKTYNSQKVTWNKVAGATEYRVFRSTDNKNFKKVATVKATKERVFNSRNLKTGKIYYYKVRAVKVQKSGLKSTEFLGNFSKIVKLKPVLYKGSVVSATNTAAGTATIKWKGVNGANGYKIYRSTTNKAGSFKLIKTVKLGSKTYKDTKLKKGKTYYYKVRAYRNVDGKQVQGNLSAAKSVKIKK